MSENLWTTAFRVVVDGAIECVQYIIQATGAAVNYFIFAAIFSTLATGVLLRLVQNHGSSLGRSAHMQISRGVEKYRKSVKGDTN